MARYLGGMPMADHRFVSWENGYVTFLARSLKGEEEDEQLWLFATSSQRDDLLVAHAPHDPLSSQRAQRDDLLVVAHVPNHHASSQQDDLSVAPRNQHDVLTGPTGLTAKWPQTRAYRHFIPTV